MLIGPLACCKHLGVSLDDMNSAPKTCSCILRPRMPPIIDIQDADTGSHYLHADRTPAHLLFSLPRAGLPESVSRWLLLLKGSISTMKSRGISYPCSFLVRARSSRSRLRAFFNSAPLYFSVATAQGRFHTQNTLQTLCDQETCADVARDMPPNASI